MNVNIMCASPWEGLGGVDLSGSQCYGLRSMQSGVGHVSHSKMPSEVKENVRIDTTLIEELCFMEQLEE